ncbi:hypothetical protein [Kitasatospora sp. NPDC087315]|uniref:hypothetical protein n=1 Tax=Kitasatospora sp. NPDC087315 TaxID=3364069 RepID=UPI0037F78425
MATSSGGGSGGRRVLGYLESTRNLVGCAAGAGGLGLHFAGLGGSWWPGVVVALYGAGALLTPGGRRAEGLDAGRGAGRGGVEESAGPGPLERVVPPSSVPALAAEVDALAEVLRGVPLPDSAKLPELLEQLRAAAPGPEAERIVRYRLPVAVDGYLRARTWQRWTPGAPDPGAELDREIERMTSGLAG